MDILTKIEQIITPTVTEMGYELVRVLFQGAPPPPLKSS